jgi:putative peptidoglycan lipid II flippase
LIGYSAVKIASPTFYSLHDSRTPVIVSMLSIAMNLVLNITFVYVLSIGHTGLALGTALAALFNAVMLMWLLGRRIGGLDGRRLTIAAIKITLASAAMGAAAVISSRWLGERFGAETEWAKAVRVFGAIAIAVGVLGLAARLLRIDEFNEATRRIMRRILPRGTAGR